MHELELAINLAYKHVMYGCYQKREANQSPKGALGDQYYPVHSGSACNTRYSELSQRRTPLGPALSVRLRVMSILYRVKYGEQRKARINSRCLSHRGVP